MGICEKWKINSHIETSTLRTFAVICNCNNKLLLTMGKQKEFNNITHTFMHFIMQTRIQGSNNVKSTLVTMQ